MKWIPIIINATMGVCIIVMIFKIKELKIKLYNKESCRTNLTRAEMKAALYNALNDTISLAVPEDTAIMPYLIKRPPTVLVEYVKNW